MGKALGNGGQGRLIVDLEGYLVQVETSKAWFAQRVLPLSVEQLRWRPSPQKWSIGECLDHLNLMLELYLPKVDDAIAGWRNGRATEGCPAWEDSEMEALRQVEPPVRVRVVAPPEVIPSQAVDADRLVDHFEVTRDRYADAVRRSRGLDVVRIRVVDPVYPVIQTLGGTLAFIAAHDRRHIWQAERVRNTRQFPRALFASWRKNGQPEDL